jgi:hypothetical protein
VVQRELKEQNQAFAKGLPKRLGSRPLLPKQAKIGFILSVLWEAGLKRLTYKQIRGFLKTADVENVPSHQALERYAQRLGLKKYYIEPSGPRG